MDAKQFLAEFGHIANAPNGITKLRELILQLAISGRLVDKAEDFRPVHELLREANDLREAYEYSLKLRSTRMHPPLANNPYTIPEHWKWERLERLCTYIQRGKGPKYVNKSSTYVVSQKCIQWSGFDLTPARHVADDSVEKYGKERFLCIGDLLWNSTGTGTAGRVAIYSTTEQQPVVADSHVTVIRLANCSPRYLWCVIASPWVQLRIEPTHTDSLVSGTTQQVELNTTTVRALPIPVPPLEEQSRIVAKVDELMALCDQLEAQQQKRRTLQNHLRQATLQAVAASQSPRELQDSWQRLQANFGQLFSAPEDFQILRDTVMDLALRGLLLPDLEYDNSTDTVLNEAQPLPKGWHWSTLAELSEYITSGSRGWKQYISSTGDSFIRSQDIKHDELQFENPAFVLLPEKTEGMRTLVQSGDLLLTITGGNVGKCAIVPKLKQDAYVSQHVALIRLRDPKMAEFLHFWMINSFGGRQFLAQYIYGDKPGLNLKQVGSVIVPVPLISDCEKVLVNLRAYQNYFDELMKKLKLKHELATVLATAFVSTLTGIAIEQEEEPMKAPQTELVAPVRLGTSPDIKAQAPLATILARHNGEMSAKDLWQRFGGEIDAFYAQLKAEVARGWLQEPEPAEMREKVAS